MSIKSFLNKLFKKSAPKINSDIVINGAKENTIKVLSDDSYCYANMVWNSENYIIILLSFTENYFNEIIDLQDAIHNSEFSNDIASKIVYSSYDEETDKQDGDGKNIWIIHKKNYMLIGGTPEQWEHIYMSINDLGNNVLAMITYEITKNCYAKSFKNLIDDDIIGHFTYNNHKPEYDEMIDVEGAGAKLVCVDPEIIMSRLPNGFTGKDILKFIDVLSVGDLAHTNAYYCLKSDVKLSNDVFAKSPFYPIYFELFKHPKSKKLKMIFEPLYKQPDDDGIAGDIDDESLDAIFRERYEKFSALADESIHYEDIDEQLAEDEESENIREGDIL